MTQISGRRRLRWIRPVCLGLMMLVLGGCATLHQSVERPDISLTGLRLVEASLGSQVYDLNLHVRNPNPFALPVRGLSYRVILAGEKFADGETTRSFTVPANGEADFELSVSTDLLRTISSLQRLFRDGEHALEYEIDGQLRVDLPFVRALPFSRSGEVDLTRPLRY